MHEVPSTSRATGFDPSDVSPAAADLLASPAAAAEPTPGCPQELFKATHAQARRSSRLFRYAKALALLGGSAAGFALAALGLCLLFGLFTLRLLAPTADQYSAELYFDFTQPLAVATAHLQSGVALRPSQQVACRLCSWRGLPSGAC